MKNKDKTYEELYLNLKKQFDYYLKHKTHNVKGCKYCKEWYRNTIEETQKYVKNKKIRLLLLQLWETLWLNNASDWDVIYYEFAGKLGGEDEK